MQVDWRTTFKKYFLEGKQRTKFLVGLSKRRLKKKGAEKLKQLQRQNKWRHKNHFNEYKGASKFCHQFLVPRATAPRILRKKVADAGYTLIHFGKSFLIPLYFSAFCCSVLSPLVIFGECTWNSIISSAEGVFIFACNNSDSLWHYCRLTNHKLRFYL